MLNSIHHIHYVVNDRDEMVAYLSSKGNRLRGEGGVTQSPRGYTTANIDPASSHGLWFQLAEG